MPTITSFHFLQTAEVKGDISVGTNQYAVGIQKRTSQSVSQLTLSTVYVQVPLPGPLGGGQVWRGRYGIS